jgi:hypothetical protein
MERLAETALTIPRAELEAERETMLFLPAWAASRIGWLGTVIINGKMTYYLTSGLPKLTEQERSTIKLQKQKIETVAAPAEGDEEKKLTLIVGMLMALGGAQISELGAQSKGEAYIFAVADMPAWAVQSAIERWYRGSVKDIDEADFKWAPSPAVLLRAARDVLEIYAETAEKLGRLIEAKPLDEVLR